MKIIEFDLSVFVVCINMEKDEVGKLWNFLYHFLK